MKTDIVRQTQFQQ